MLIQKQRYFLLFAILFPLLTAFVAMDIYRWINSANMALTYVKVASKTGYTNSKWNILMLFFVFWHHLVRQGMTFPMHQFIL